MHMLMGSRPVGQRAAVGGCGLGWWWHTEEDTLDKADRAVLETDVRIYALTALRLCNASRLPYDVAALANEAQTELRALAAAAGEHVDLGSVISLAGALCEKAGDLGQIEDDEAYNRAVMGIIKAVNPVNYTAHGPFDHDAAVPAKPFPGLQAAARLPRLPREGNAYGFLRTRLVRERNRIAEALAEAIRSVPV
jgi:hypothetical protein